MHKLYQLLTAKSLIAAVVFFSALPFGSSAQKIVEGVIRIKVSDDLSSRLEVGRFSRNPQGDVVTGVESLDRINKQFNVKDLKRVFPHAGKYEARHRRHGLHLWYEVTMDKRIPVSDVLQSYKSDRHILRAEAVLQKAIIGSNSPGVGPRVLKNEGEAVGDVLPDASNDPLLASQWHYNNSGQTGGTPGADIKLFEAWKSETGSPEVVIAVTDGGIQTDHPDLAANMWVNPGEIAGNNLDDDNNGYVDDIHGYSFVSGSGNITAHEHGTHVAGTIAAVNNNGAGVAGVAGGSGNGDGVRLMSCAVFSDEGAPDGFAEAYVYSADNGAVISQNSWGYTMSGTFEQVVLEAIDYFIEEAGKNEFGQQTGPMNGGIAIFSSGNFNDEGNYYPAFYDPVLAVAATNHKDLRAHYSNYGTWVDIAAPGGETSESEAEGVVSTLPGGQYGAFMGTSMACPHVSGVAGLIISKFGKPGFHPDVLRARLLLSVDEIETLNPGFSGKLGSGRLNAALALHQGDQTPPDAIDDLSVAGTDVGEITLTWTSPRDEGDFVAGYDLRYSTSPITLENFATATPVDGLHTPATPGTPESFTITDLPGGTLFYFAIRSMDFEGNHSPLSNVVSQTSALTPTLVITSAEITENLETAETSVRSFLIRNEGEGLLRFTLQPFPENTFAAATPQEGQVAPGSSQSVTVSFDASEKFAGTYQQDIVINSNDPLKKTATIRLVLHVSDNGAPIATVAPEAVDFKSVQVGAILRRMVKVHNAGSDPLVIDGITSDHEAFSSDFATPFTIEPFETTDVPITFAPTTTGQFSSEVRLLTNDPVNSALRIQVVGEGLQEAPLVVSPASFNETLEQGTRITRKMVLRNNGSQERSFRLETMDSRLRSGQTETSARSATGRVKADDDTTHLAVARRLEKHQAAFASKPADSKPLALPLSNGAASRNRSAGARTTGDKTPAYKRELREYVTGFEEFTTGPLGDQHGWFTTQGWTVADKNPDAGAKHLRGVSTVSGTGESYAISPYLFEYEEFYYPQYSSTSMRLNLDNAKGTSWEIVPQDPWSYVATRIRFNADGTIEAMVIDNEYEIHWKKVPVSTPSGYFDLAIEYNNAGSDTSGFPTYYLFINNAHVFSGTGLGSGIGQVAFVSPMETTGPVLDIDGLHLTGGEYIPPFVKPEPIEGVIAPGTSVDIDVEFDASIMKYGIYESAVIIYLDEIDSLVVPVTLTVPGEPSYFRDVYSIYMVLDKDEVGRQDMSVRNTGGAPIDFRFEHAIPGLTLTPQSASIRLREEEVVEIRFDGPPGVYEDHILIHTNISAEPDRMPVHITRLDSGAVFFAPETLSLQAYAGEISTETIQLRNDGVNTVSYIATTQDLDSVISMDPEKTTISDEPVNLTLTIDARDLTPGSYTGRIRFMTNDPDRRNVYTEITLNVLPDATSGKILREVWSGIPGREIASIPLATTPSSVDVLTKFQSPSNTGDNFGARIRGWIMAPATGAYTFWIASDDGSELWLSADENEAGKEKIAHVAGFTTPLQWNKYPGQVSRTINLVANRKYYIEVLHKEGTGADHLAVGWKLPDGALERPIPGIRLIPYNAEAIAAPPVVSITSPQEGELFTAPADILITADAGDEDGTIVKVEFFEGTTRLATDTSAPYSYAWNNVPAGTYSILAKATDDSGMTDSATVNITVTEEQACADAGSIVREQWDGIPGTLISSIPLGTAPSSTEVLTLFEGPSNVRDNYGTRIRGFLCVPVAGNYTFWIASNDKSELWLSTDADPANKRKIAEVSSSTNPRQWTKFPAQKSGAINLEPGRKYYIEALHKEGIGTDHLAVGWQLPDGTLERPVPGIRLMPFETPGSAPVVHITSPAQGQTFPAPSTIQISAEASDEDGYVRKVEFYLGDEKLGEDTSAPFTHSWTVGEAGVYPLRAVAIDNDGKTTSSETVKVSVHALCSATGTITREYWTGISGNGVSTIPVGTAPDGIQELGIFEGPVNAGTNYGARIRGYICPPMTGEYTFWISSNDHSVLSLSTDETEGNKRMIAYVTGATDVRQWNKFATQKSVSITLTQGKRYYIEALHKQGIGTDHVAVGWQLPDGAFERPIAGSRLSGVNTSSAAMASPDLFTAIEETLSVDVYPNPVKGEKLRITINRASGSQEDAVGELVIRQLTGLSVYRETIRCSEGCTTEIDVQKNFTPGIYILQVKTGGHTVTEKLIVP